MNKTIYIKEIEDSLKQIMDFPDLDEVVKYVVKLLRDHTEQPIQYDRLKPCCICQLDGRQVQPSIHCVEHKEGMCGSWYNEYYVACTHCRSESEHFDDWQKDAKKLAIIEWNKDN